MQVKGKTKRCGRVRVNKDGREGNKGTAKREVEEKGNGLRKEKEKVWER